MYPTIILTFNWSIRFFQSGSTSMSPATGLSSHPSVHLAIYKCLPLRVNSCPAHRLLVHPSLLPLSTSLSVAPSVCTPIMSSKHMHPFTRWFICPKHRNISTIYPILFPSDSQLHINHSIHIFQSPLIKSCLLVSFPITPGQFFYIANTPYVCLYFLPI